MKTVKAVPGSFGPALKEAKRVISAGGIVAVPTETFYALCARFDMEGPLLMLYRLKGRPAEKAMPLMAGGMESLLKAAASLNETEKKLAGLFWPGPLTILFAAREGLSEYVCSKGRVAVRVPSGRFALRLLTGLGFPVTSTSANPSGLAPPEDPQAVIRHFGGKIDLVIDGGRTPGGLPSTILEASGDEIKIVREGAISLKEITERLGKEGFK